jgi:putative ABC transport system permease protein
MFKHYLKSAIRNLGKHKLYTAINVFGLTIGLAACLAVIGYAAYELSFEDPHINKDRIYRIRGSYTSLDPETREVKVTKSVRVMAPLGRALLDEVPEVENVAVFRPYRRAQIEVDRILYKDRKFICADPRFFEIFTFQLLLGDPETALNRPFSALITEDAAAEYFPQQDPIGKMVKINGQTEYQITGVLKKIPDNTQLTGDFITSYATLGALGEDTESWDNFEKDFVYLLLNENADPMAVESKIPAILNKYLDAEIAAKYNFELQSFKDVYFSVYDFEYTGDIFPAGELSMIIALIVVAFFILLLAIANFVNLSTARSSDRITEVGMRKVLGAVRGQLIRQYIGESIIIAILSSITALAIYELFRHMVRPMLPRDAMVNLIGDPLLILFVVVFVLVVGILAGFYPALYLTRFRPISILQNRAGIRSSRSFLRKSLVVLQFTIAICFICSTVIIYKQFFYISSFDLGFDKENVLLLDFEGEQAADKCQLMKNEIMSNCNVLSATMVNTPPARMRYQNFGFYPDENREEESLIVAKGFYVDYDFFSTFDLEIIEGRNFDPDNQEDLKHSMIINESMAKNLGIENPIGHRLYGKDKVFRDVIGVVKEFQGSPMNYAYRDNASIIYNPQGCRTLAVKLPTGDLQNSIAAIKIVWDRVVPEWQFKYSFLDDEISANYDEAQMMGNSFLAISAMAIVIACLGIMGLVSFTAQKRTKEIGIRKVLGASVESIVRMLSREFLMLIALANLIAWPLAYLGMREFLMEYPFRTSIGIGAFILTGCIAAALALLAAGFQAVKAALTNPVEALRHE